MLSILYCTLRYVRILSTRRSKRRCIRIGLNTSGDLSMFDLIIVISFVLLVDWLWSIHPFALVFVVTIVAGMIGHGVN